MDTIQRFQGCLIGLAAGDALGAQVEFRQRGQFVLPTELTGGGPFNLGPGEWTDDTSMALCLAESLLHCQGFNAVDQMNRYCNWMNHGYLSSNGRCFDIGMTTANALRHYIANGDPFAGSTDPQTAGNGSLMRLAPIAMYWANDREQAIHYAGQSSRTTHGAIEAIEACRCFAEFLWRALNGQSKVEILAPLNQSPSSAAIATIINGDWHGKTFDEIASSGYVVHSLQAALWCFAQTSTFEEAILTAIRLGDDTDTTAAITGQLAGAYYGIDAIPSRWLNRLVELDMLQTKANALFHASEAHVRISENA